MPPAESQNPATGMPDAALPVHDLRRGVVPGAEAQRAAERALADEELSADEIAAQSGYQGPDTDIGQHAASSERERSKLERSKRPGRSKR